MKDIARVNNYNMVYNTESKEKFDEKNLVNNFFGFFLLYLKNKKSIISNKDRNLLTQLESI